MLAIAPLATLMKNQPTSMHFKGCAEVCYVTAFSRSFLHLLGTNISHFLVSFVFRAGREKAKTREKVKGFEQTLVALREEVGAGRHFPHGVRVVYERKRLSGLVGPASGLAKEAQGRRCNATGNGGGNAGGASMQLCHV
jgi:hypothetical protein